MSDTKNDRDGNAHGSPEISDRLAGHPMFSPSDLRYLRHKGYSDEEILAFWDRDHAVGKEPVHHGRHVNFTFEGIELPAPTRRSSTPTPTRASTPRS